MQTGLITTRFWLALGLLTLSAATAADPTAAHPWQTIEPAGDTRCADGTPYRFLVRPADPQKILFHLQGGGGCWRRENCDPDMQPTYRINTQSLAAPQDGIFNFERADNPFKDYSVVFAAYCTGDIHLGARDQRYPGVLPGQPPLTIYHRGRSNVEAALQWTYANLPAPRAVFVSGSSAGALPSPMYAAILARHYPQAKFAHLGDAAGGYRFDEPDTRPDEIWGSFEFLPQTEDFAGIAATDFSYEAIYRAAAAAHPAIVFARYDNAEDEAQKRFLAMRGITDISLLTSLRANNADIRRSAPNFRAYIAGGSLHTILGRPEFYTLHVGATRIRDWVAALAARQPVADVACTDCLDAHLNPAE